MGFLQRLFGRGGAEAAGADRNAHHLYVKCAHCGTCVHTRIDLHNDLSPDDDGGYVVRKTLVDDRCFRRMEALLRFDQQRRLVDQQVQGGDIIDRDAYDSARRLQHD